MSFKLSSTPLASGEKSDFKDVNASKAITVLVKLDQVVTACSFNINGTIDDFGVTPDDVPLMAADYAFNATELAQQYAYVIIDAQYVDFIQAEVISITGGSAPVATFTIKPVE